MQYCQDRLAVRRTPEVREAVQVGRTESGLGSLAHLLVRLTG